MQNKMPSIDFTECVVEAVLKHRCEKVDFTKLRRDDSKILSAVNTLLMFDFCSNLELVPEKHLTDAIDHMPNLIFENAYLLAYYTIEYITIHLSHEIMDQTLDDLIKIVERYSIKLLPPSITKSEMDFIIEDDKSIRCGLLSLGYIIDVIELRDKEGFTGFEDLVIKATKAGINESTIQILIESGALDEFGYNRRSMTESYKLYIGSSDKQAVNIINVAEYELKALAEMEFISCGTAFSSKCVLDDEGYFLHY
jgi:hypothetical protein